MIADSYDWATTYHGKYCSLEIFNKRRRKEEKPHKCLRYLSTSLAFDASLTFGHGNGI